MSKRRAKSAYRAPTQPFNIRLLPGDRATMEEVARLDGIGVVEWARRVLFRAAGLPVEGAAMRKGWPKGRLRGRKGTARTALDGRSPETGPTAPPDRPDAA